MREIKIAQRYRPFSHLPGVTCMLPGTLLSLQCFPTLVKIFKGETQINEEALPHSGPVTDFTVQLDLEKGYVNISGWAKKQFFRYRCSAIKKEPFYSFTSHEPIVVSAERLALGKDKALDWELVKRRADLCEILPIWLKLAQWIPIPYEQLSFSQSLFERCQQDHYESFWDFFRAGFRGLFVPRSKDDDRWGYELPPIPADIDPLRVFAHSIPLIRQLFCESDAQTIKVLPKLFPEFHSGRYIQIPTSFGLVNLEWTSHLLKKVYLQAACSKTIYFEFPKYVKRFRLRKTSKEKGIWLDKSSAIDITEGDKYCLDRFEK